MTFNSNEPARHLTASKDIPDALTEQQAQKILTEYQPVVRELEQETTRVDERISQGKIKVAALLAEAREKFGVDTPEQIEAIIAERMRSNAANARAFVQSVEDCQAQRAEIRSAAVLS